MWLKNYSQVKLGLSLVLMVTLVACLTSPATTLAHSDVILGCGENVKILKADKIVEASIFPLGLVIEEYDTNGDGKGDIAAVSHLLPVGPPDDPMPSHRPLAKYYFRDANGDGQWDEIYEDQSAEEFIRFTVDYPCEKVKLILKEGDSEFQPNIYTFWFDREIKSQS